MRAHVQLGRVAGIAVGLHWSVLVIFLLVAFGLAAGRFPALYPDLPTAAYVTAGLVTAVVFFLSLLAHEVSHAVVARRNGVGVEGITLWLFGGVARLTGDAPDPGADLRIAGIGPLVSLLLAAGFGALAVVSSVAVPALVTGTLTWLAIINVVLAVFNLAPAAPLDGGRLLRAGLWKLRGDRTRAAVAAARAGRGFGWLLVGLGILQFAIGAGFGGLWLVLIGWFLSSAATAEEEQAEVSALLSDVRVRDVMTAEPTQAPSSLTVAEVVEDYVLRTPHSAFPLRDEAGRPDGLVTLNRLKRVPADERDRTPVRDVACGLDDAAIANPDEPLTDVLPRLSACGDGRALVLDDGELVGIVSSTDVSRALERASLRRGVPQRVA